MESTSPASPPPHLLVFILWFVTLIIGAALLAAFLEFTSPYHPSDAVGVALVGSGFAGFFSSPLLLVLPASMRWVFTAATVQQRWYRLLLSIISLFAVITLGVCWLLTNGDIINGGRVLSFAVPYLVAAILSAIYIYRPWLFHF